MAIQELAIGQKTENQGATAGGRLTAQEFNNLIEKVNELVRDANKTVYLTQDEYDALVENNQIQEDVEYNVYEE